MKLLCLLLCCVALNGFGGSIPLERQAAFFVAPAGSASGGGGGGSSPFAFITNGVSVVSGVNDCTTPARNATGAKLAIVAVQFYQGVPSISDGVNTWTKRVQKGDQSGNYTNVLYDCVTFTPSSTHTVTISGAGYVRADIQYFSDTGTPVCIATNGFENGNGNATTTIATGAVTPTANGALLFASTVWNNTATVTINSSFGTPVQGQELSDPMFGAESYLLQTNGPTAVNPTFTYSATINAGAATIALYQ